ncbi:MAG: LptF/LptG family permease [Kiritimatiellae bacterium]|nr:LptF/LptG family permease [Kiritimatiellia bacterium]
MKLLDRYLLRRFFAPLVVCCAAFTMVYVVFDLFNNLSDFLQGRASLPSLLLYYLLLIPASLNYIVPVSMVLATLWSLSQLTRHNEITAMRACGLSLVRLMLPLMVIGLVASGVVLAVNETMGSEAAYRTRQFVRVQGRSDADEAHIAGPLPYHNPTERRSWLIGRFDTLTHQMQNIQVVQQSAAGRDIWKAFADEAVWTGGAWWFYNVRLQYYDANGHPLGPPRILPLRPMTEFTETPREFLNEIKDPEFLTAAELVRFIRTHPQLDARAVQRLRVTLHSRLALPWGCLIAVLFGIPFGTTTARKGAFRGIVLCLALFFSSWAMVSLGLWAGKMGLIPAWVGGWGPTLLYLAIGLRLALRDR